MTMRPFTDNRGGLNHLVDAQIGRAFPVVHKVYQHLDAIEYVAQVYESGRSRDIVLRTNHTKEWIEWQYKGEAKWTILFKFSDLLGADIADVVAAEQAIASELVALREYINQTRSETLAASDRAQAAELGAIVAKDVAEAAQASASTSAQEATASAVAAAQSAQGIHDAKDATEVIAATAETYRDAAAQSAQQAADSANSADSVKVFVVSARAEAEGFASIATTASTEAKAAQQAAESSAAAALTSENQASASALASAASETATLEKHGEVNTLHDAAVIASTTATGAAESATARLAQVTTLHSATESFAQAAQASAEQADIAATAAGVSASDALQLRNETQGFHDAASTMVVDAAQVSADRATVQTLAQEVANNITAAQDAAAAALDSQTSASESATQAAASLTAVVPLHTEVVTKHAEVLVRADQVAEDLLAADAAKGAAEIAQADAESAEALASAWATKMDGPVLNDGSDKFSAQYWAIQAEQSATVAADANTGVLGALANHTAAADPHTQYLTKAESTVALAVKVDKEVGKGLSTEDYTTAEQAKLASVETGANAYTHPANHPASIITQDANNRFVTDAEKVAWNAKQTLLVSGTNIKTINGESLLGGGNLVVESGASIPNYLYENRATLRTLVANAGDLVLVDGLGLFIFAAGSDEPDDDESCFSTATGRWLLECPHWDVVSLWQLPDDAVRDEYDEDEPLRFASSFASKVLSGTATCAITSVATVSSARFTGTVTGASVGDRVIATPPAELGATAAETGRLSYHAWVSAANTVTVTLTNGSAAAANTNAAIRAAWPITVIKS